MNWQKLLKDLSNKGVTQMQIAQFCRCRQTTVSLISRGVTSDPRTAIGLGLMRLAVMHGVAIDDLRVETV